MKTGVLLFCHNNRDLDYALMATIAGGLAKKNLKRSVSVITDQSTLDWVEESGNELFHKVFDNIITTEKPEISNYRKLYDGVHSKNIPFINSSRCDAWELTPYDRTLLIDTDYLVMSDHLNQYWDLDQDIMISPEIRDAYSTPRIGVHDRYVSDVGCKLYWATTVMFTKNRETEIFFDLVKHIRDNYEYYGDLYQFRSRQYRNDISFSIALHMLNYYQKDDTIGLPPVLSTMDKDILVDVKENGRLTFLLSPMLDSKFCAGSFFDLDIHVMNKQSIIRNSEKLLGLL